MPYKTLGIVEEGQCERCGTNCPKRRVAVVQVDAGGAEIGGVQRWGVNCAALARFGSKAARHQSTILAEAAQAKRDREWRERVWLRRVIRVGETVYVNATGSFTTIEVPAPKSLNDAKSLANRKYNTTGAPLVGSYFAQRGDDEVVRVNGQRPEEVKFFESQGFVRVSEPVQEAI